MTTRLGDEISEGIIQDTEEAKNQTPIGDILVEQGIKENNVNCKCRWKNCKRHGKCEECIAHHAQHEKHPLPSCMKKSKPKTK